VLSEQSTPVIRATLPMVGAAIDEITGRFYQRLFEAGPELLRDLFNRGNQANGEQRRALAGSIAAFAGFLLERPEGRPDAVLDRIAHKRGRPPPGHRPAESRARLSATGARAAFGDRAARGGCPVRTGACPRRSA
jgi:hypothetical protein